MKFKLFILALIPLLVASCSREPLPIPVEEEGKIITIKVDIAPETRVAYSGGTGNDALSWETGDQIMLLGYVATTNQGTSIFNWDGGNNFTGSIVPGSHYYSAYYPADAFVSSGDAGIANLKPSFSWAQTQDGNGSTAHLSSKLLMWDDTWARLITQGFNLELQSSILKFDLTNLPDDIGTLTELRWKIANSSGVVQSTMTLNISNVTISSGNTSLTAYHAFDPSLLAQLPISGKFIIELIGTKSYKCEKTSDHGKAYVAGKLYKATVSSNTDWTPL